MFKLVVLWQLHDHPLLQPRGEMDSGVYLDLARQVAGGDLMAGGRVFFVSPLYVYFLAAVLALSGGSVVIAQMTQVALGTLAVWLVALTAQLWLGRRAALTAGLLAGLCGYLTFNEVLILQSSLDPFLTALGLWLLARAWTRQDLAAYAAAGCVLGVHLLNRPNIGVWALAAVALTALPCRRAAVVRSTVLAAGLLLALLPVAARNYAVAGALAPVSSHGGLNFYIGNNPGADGTYHLVAGITPSIAGQDRDMRTVAERAAGRPLTDSQASSWFYSEAWRWIRSSPTAAARLFAKKLLYVFNATDLPLNFSYAFYRDDENTLLKALVVGPWLLLPLGIAGFWLGRPSAAAWWRWVGFIPVYAVSVAAFFVAGRYRLPILVACCVTSASALVALWDRFRAGGARPGVFALVPVAALAVLTNLDLHLENGKGGERTEMLLYEIDTRQDESARQLLERTLREDRQPALVLFRAGQAYRERGDPAVAAPLLERGHRLAPDDPTIELSLGQALFDSGRPADALPHLRAAVAAGAGGSVAAFDLARALSANGDPEGAVSALRRISSPAALDGASQLAVGRLALELGDARLAEPFLSSAASRLPADAGAQESLGLALGLLGRRAEAIAALEASCRLAPADSRVRLNLGVMYAEAGRTADARRMAQDAVRLDPGYAQARRFLEALK